EGRLAAETARRVEEAREALTARMAGHEERITALNGQQQQITQVADQLKSELTGNRSELQTVRSEQAEAIERLAAETARRVEEAREALTARMAGHEEQIAALDRAVGERITSVSETLAGLERRASTRQDIEEVRRQQAAAVGEVLKLIGRQSDELVVFRGEVAVQAERRSGEQKALYEEIRSRISAQAEHLAQLQARLVEETKLVQARFAELSERFAERAEVEALDAKQAARIAALRRDGESYAAEISHLRESHEALEGRQAAQVTELRQNREMDAAEIARLRESHEAHATEVLGRIDANRDTLKKLFGTVLKRFRATQERLATLASSTVGKDELADLRARQERESQALLEQFEGQKLAMEARFDRIVWRLQETKNQLDTLSADTAKAADFEQFRCQAAEDREKVLALLSVQRRDMESMAEATQARCEALSARLDALPADIATAGQVEQVRHEHAEQIREVLGQLDQSIRQVSEYCDRTSTAVAALAAEAATSSEVGELRDEHTRKIDEIQGRMNQQEESQLNRLHLLARRVKEHARRMGQLEEQAGTPVRLELAPTAGAKLGHIVEAAHQQHSCLTEAVERAGTIASYLHEASSRVQATLTQWADNADRVDEQSRHLRTAAETSARILIAMKKCHSALDRKLNSSRWQQELARGEAVSQRLDKSTAEAQAAVKQLNAVLRDFDRIQETADDWSARTKRTQNTVEEMTRQARQTVQQLSRLLAEASSTNSKFDQSLNRRKQMLNAVAQNTTRLMELIETAHQVDEGTGKAASRKTDSRKIDRSPRVSGIDWPNLRVRSTAHVG
ncbi:MAG TPA: hypothetical protein VLM89_13220, partial [Phycisphaerae bacterium]|nr:hypothetical protein [Phycisphaerae bacterium]